MVRLFMKKREINLEALSDTWKKAAETIRFKIAESFKLRLDDYFDTYQLDGNIVSVAWPIDAWVPGFFISIGADIEVMEPAHLREKVCEKIKRLHALYK